MEPRMSETVMKQRLRDDGYVVTIYIHLDTVAVSINTDDELIYSTPEMTVMTEQEAIVDAYDYIYSEG